MAPNVALPIEVAKSARWWAAERLDPTTSKWEPMVQNNGGAKPRKWFTMPELTREVFATFWGPGIYRIHTGTERRKQWTSGALDLREEDPAPPAEQPPEAQPAQQAPAPPPQPVSLGVPYVAPMMALPYTPPPGAPAALTEFVYVEGLVQQRAAMFLQMMMAQHQLAIEAERTRSRESIESARQHYAALAMAQDKLTAALFAVQTQAQQAAAARPAVAPEVAETLAALAQGQQQLSAELAKLAEDPEELAAELAREPNKVEVLMQGFGQLLQIAGPLYQQWQKVKAEQSGAGQQGATEP